MDDTVNKSNGRGVILGIIAFLIVVLIGIGIYLYLVGPRTNIYLQLIDKITSYSANTLNNVEFNDKNETVYETSMNIKSMDKEMQKSLEPLNKLKIKTKIQSDINDKKINGNLELFYDNKSVIEGNIYLNNNEAYLGSESLYPKLIKFSLDELFGIEELWDRSNIKDYKVIIREYANILKNNLKEEYFNTSTENINVLGKEVNVLKQTLTLTYKDINDLEANIKKDALNNNDLLKSLSNITKLSIDEIKEYINSEELSTDSISALSDNEHKDNDVAYLAELYINKRNQKIEYAVIKEESSKVEFVKSSEDTYNIILDENKIGSLSVNNFEFSVTVNTEDVKVLFSIKGNTLNVKFENGDVKVDALVIGNKDAGEMTISVNDELSNIEAKVNISFSSKNIKELDNVDYSNNIPYEQLTEDDLNSIMTKINENQNLATMIQDIMSQYGETEIYYN